MLRKIIGCGTSACNASQTSFARPPVLPYKSNDSGQLFSAMVKPTAIDNNSRAALSRLSPTNGQELMNHMKRNAIRRSTQSQRTDRVEYDEFWPRHSKAIIDKVDRELAQHYNFTYEELDFIINHDIKYRVGRDDENEGK
jgi:hypothetical protein